MKKTATARRILADNPEATLPQLVALYRAAVEGATYKQAITRLHAARIPLRGGHGGKRTRRFVKESQKVRDDLNALYGPDFFEAIPKPKGE